VQGRRYSEYSGSETGQCVIRVDAGVSKCAPSFAALPGVTGHLYYLFTTPSDFTSQRSACAAQGPTTYLAIPDDATELGALDTLAGATATYWVGISDTATEGTWLTVKGGTQTFLPWETGHPITTPPNNQNDCVRVVTADAKFFDDKCNTQLAAICECE
jgi:hypothetical protein